MSAVSEFNQRAYELFARPLMQAMSNEYSAKLSREFHPLRFQRWAISDLNPWLWWLAPTARGGEGAAPGRWQPTIRCARAEKMMSELTSASLDYYRALRDAVSEAAFFQIYGNLFSLYLADKREAAGAEQRQPIRASCRSSRKRWLRSTQGGYPEAVARVAFLLARKGEPLPLSRLQLKQELIGDYRDLLPAIPRDEARRIRGEQEIIVRYEPEKAVATLPALLTERADRERLLTLLDRLLADERVQRVEPLPRADGDARAHPRVLGARAGRESSGALIVPRVAKGASQ